MAYLTRCLVSAVSAGQANNLGTLPFKCLSGRSPNVNVRCCADVSTKGSKKSRRSARTCKSLHRQYGGWLAKGGSPQICGESDNGLGVSQGFSDLCAKDKGKGHNKLSSAFLVADSICLGAGA